MAWNARAVTRPPLPADDVDYSAVFQALSEVHAALRREGVTAPLLLRRAHCRFALGNYLAAAFDAERVSRQDPGCLDAHYLKGQACMAMVAVKLGLARAGVGVYLPAEGLPSRTHLLGVARRAFEAVLDGNPDDEQARRALAIADEWTREFPDAPTAPAA